MLNYLFVEYPSSTEEFLKRKVGLVSRTSTFSHVYRGVYANTLRWKRVLRQLPNLQELRPTDAQLLKFGQLRARQNAEILRIAEERSVFAQISTKINIRQGHRFASHTKFGPPQIAEMSQLSRSMELPSSERADPVGGILRRAGLLRNAR